MATYTLSFKTRVEFETALASGSSSLGSLLTDGLSVENKSVAVVCCIEETGESVTCGTNIVLDINSATAGDVVLYQTSKGKFIAVAEKYLQVPYPNSPTQKTMRYRSSCFESDYIYCGIVVNKNNNRLRIAGAPVSKGMTKSATQKIAGSTYTTFEKRGGGSSPVDPITGESPDSVATKIYCNVKQYEAISSNIHRSDWDEAIATMTDRSDNATISLGGKNFCPAVYNYSYEKFVEYFYLPKYPADTGRLSEDQDGRKNTRETVDLLLEQNTDLTSDDISLGALYCWNLNIDAPYLKKGNWFIGSVSEMIEVCNSPAFYSVITEDTYTSNMCTYVRVSSGGYNHTAYVVNKTGIVGNTGGSEAMNRSRNIVPLADIYI